jgi:hypothetical protein
VSSFSAPLLGFRPTGLVAQMIVGFRDKWLRASFVEDIRSRNVSLLDEIHVVHVVLPDPALLRQGFGGQPRSNLVSAVLLA